MIKGESIEHDYIRNLKSQSCKQMSKKTRLWCLKMGWGPLFNITMHSNGSNLMLTLMPMLDAWCVYTLSELCKWSYSPPQLKTACQTKFWSEKVLFSAWKMVACINVQELAGSVSDIVCSYAHTWPIFCLIKS